MRRFERPEIRAKYGSCISCGNGTRSHVLEPALYEEFEEEVVVAASDMYSSNQWEDVETITKALRVEEAVVMCHSCWKDALEYYNTELPKMTFDGAGRYKRLANVLHNIRYYNLDSHLSSEAKDSLTILRKSLSTFLGKAGGEEE